MQRVENIIRIILNLSEKNQEIESGSKGKGNIEIL